MSMSLSKNALSRKSNFFQIASGIRLHPLLFIINIDFALRSFVLFDAILATITCYLKRKVLELLFLYIYIRICHCYMCHCQVLNFYY